MAEASTAFHGKARAYADGRPGYPADAMMAIGALIRGYAPNARVADVGAGTGLLTQELAVQGMPIVAVEPDADMRAELERHVRAFPNVTVSSGSAEHTGLPDNSIDVVTCAQALHWFDHDAFLAECARIGRGGRVLLISVYNRTSFDSAAEPGAQGSALHGSIEHVRRTTAEYFTHPEIRQFANSIRYTRERWRTFMDSHSHSPLPGDPAYAAHRAWVDEIFDRRAVNGVLVDDTMCVVTSEVLQPA